MADMSSGRMWRGRTARHRLRSLPLCNVSMHQVSAATSGPPLRRDTDKPHHVRRGASTATRGAYFHSRTVLGNAIC